MREMPLKPHTPPLVCIFCFDIVLGACSACATAATKGSSTGLKLLRYYSIRTTCSVPAWAVGVLLIQR